MFTAWREFRFGGKLNTQCLPGLMRRAWLCPRTRVRQMKPRAGKNYAAEHIAVPFEYKRRRRPTNKNALGALPCAAVFGFPYGLHPWSKLTVATSSLLAAGWHFVENQIDLKPRFPDDKKYLLTNKPPSRQGLPGVYIFPSTPTNTALTSDQNRFNVARAL